jgi:hypothetical protein
MKYHMKHATLLGTLSKIIIFLSQWPLQEPCLDILYINILVDIYNHSHGSVCTSPKVKWSKFTENEE